MSDLLRGNFTAKNKVEGETRKDDATDVVERAAMRRLGGSIAYVSKKKFVWAGDPGKTPPGDDKAG